MHIYIYIYVLTNAHIHAHVHTDVHTHTHILHIIMHARHVNMEHIYYMRSTIGGDLIWWFGGFALNHQIKIIANQY